MIDVILTDIRRIDAPYRREVLLQEALHDSGMKLLRIRIREGHRFTLLDVDAATAEALAETILEWARRQPAETAVAADGSGEGGASIA